MKNVKSCGWVVRNLDKVLVFDAGIVKPGLDEPYEPVAIAKGARRFDISYALAKPNTGLSNMMCDQYQFQSHMRQLGVNQADTIVVYDDKGLFSAARAWWMLKSMGFDQVFIMDGGLPEWLRCGYPTQQAYTKPKVIGDFIATLDLTHSYFINRDKVLCSISSNDYLLLDARSPLRFSGSEAEPRIGMRSGHIPNSKNLHYQALLTREGRLRSINELATFFHQLGCENKSLQFSCGSGVTACILALAADECGYGHLSVYDGSWSEWGRTEFTDELPIHCDEV
ncbi:thiosulfate/3-mercaptopyruvate sulfurtransferase [Pseudoalteromonas citrea]|uniref:Thiosulfate/3-mercaptopyruvate sulfurtransferase n=2 Tax=Pseudoalteromonas citrea TaxID=43655 RepID=A0AAD4AGU4_9GAMM|nr:sulfurtransferase [Pseudoalteromonas citrea]KAF7768772.1 thiosulfate/3-mercaptopyruvate sulfurtransferase [Pseudoalteromonas citrea]